MSEKGPWCLAQPKNSAMRSFRGVGVGDLE